MTLRDFIIACLLPLGIAAVAHAAPAPREGGIWKAIVPPGPVKAEFDGYDPIGIATGQRIQADCSLNWVSPDDGARYCFSSGTSLEFFLDRPQEYIKRARENWTRMHRQ
jgi:YHS domain-containing protein